MNYITNEFKNKGKININELVQKFIPYKQDLNNTKINSTVNVGFTLDPGYILETMLTAASIMATQYKTTKIVFHFGVVGDFNAKEMIKIYELKDKINNSTEFNFYYLKGAEEKMQNFHEKGVACPGKFELPELLPDNVERLLIFDAGDVLIFRDLTELYNYDMKDFWALGTPEPWCISEFVQIYNITKYINIGSVLINVKKLKENSFWELYTKNRNLKVGGAPDQTLFNIVVPDIRKDYFPFRFGGIVPFYTDKDSDELKFAGYGMINWLNSTLAKDFPENPLTEVKLVAQIYNSVFIHQFCAKWSFGYGLSIFRNLAKYFIKLADIGEEICKKMPGYCF